MSYTYIALSILALALSALARPEGQVRHEDLSSVMNKSICPIVVKIDENPHRIPRRIKILKCAERASDTCEQHHIPKHECCHHVHSHYKRECVEIRDTVLVFDTLRNENIKQDVSVGCTCMVEPVADAYEMR